MKYFRLGNQKIKQTVFRTIYHEIVNKIFLKISKLYFQIQNNDHIFEWKDLRDFYFERSLALSWWQINIEELEPYLNKFSLKYITNKGYQSSTNSFVFIIKQT